MTVAVIGWTALMAMALFLGIRPPGLQTLNEQANEHRVSHAPQRAVIYPPLLAAYLTIDGKATNILAASEAEIENLSADILRRIFPSAVGLQTVATVGGRSAVPADPEQVISLAPDAVLVWPWATGGLERIGIPLASISVTDAVGIWQRIGDITDQRERVDDAISDSSKREATLVSSLEHLSINRLQRAAVLWRNASDIWSIASKNHHHARSLAMLGAEDISSWVQSQLGSGGNIRVGIETVLKFDPDIVFLSCCTLFKDNPATFYGNPVFASLKAVRTRRVYKVPMGGARMDGIVDGPLLLRWYAELLYPSYLHAALRHEVMQVYQQAYDYRPNDDELDMLLLMNENGSSFSYSRFVRGRHGAFD